jgi:CRP/FNR family transcriptional regulator
MASNFTQSLSANRTGCAGCYLRHLCLSADLNDAETEIFSSHIVSQRRVPKGEVLFRAGAPLDALFVTRLGSFKSSVLTENGSEQVTDFHMSGEVLGAEAIPTEYHTCTVTALEDSEICSLRYRELEALCDRDPKISRQFRLLLGRKIVAAHQNLLILGCTNSTQLLDLARKFEARGFSKSEFVLRMTRGELGSFLGLKLETVSRTLTHFDELNLIEINQRHVRIINLEGLKAVAKESGRAKRKTLQE